MPISAQDNRHSVGEFDCKTKNYVPDCVIQQRINNMSRRQEQNSPQALGWLSTLFFVGVLSNLTCGRNTSEGINDKNEKTQTPNTEGSSNNVLPTLHHVTRLSTMPFVPTVSAYSSPLPLLNTMMSPCLKTSITHMPLSFSFFAQNVIETIHQKLHTIKDILYHSDPIKFPSAGASVPALATTAVTTTEPLDEVVVKRINFQCIEERRDLSLSDLLFKLADSLEHPIMEMAREFQVVAHYVANGVCPSRESVERILNISADTDIVLNEITSLLPQFKTILVTQKVIAPLLRMLADEMTGKEITDVEIENVNDDMLFLAKSLIDLFPKNNDGQPKLEEAKIPAGVSIKNNEVYVAINNDAWLISHQNEQLYASKEGMTRAVTYHEDEEIWKFSSDSSSNAYTEEDDLFFTACRHRRRRGANLGILCQLNIPEDVSISERSDPTSLSDVNSSNVNVHDADAIHLSNNQHLINELAIDLPKTSSRITKMHFSDAWEIYRVRISDDARSRFFHAIEIDGKLVPVRTMKIYHYHLHCEIYDLKYSQIGYPVEFYQGRWQLESPTSRHVSTPLAEMVQPEMYAKGIMAKDLSIPGHNGLKWSADGRCFLKINYRYVEISREGGDIFIQFPKGDRYYLAYENEKFIFSKAVCSQGKFSVNAEQLKMDKLMYSPKGLKVWIGKRLNNGWRALSVNIKCQDYNGANSVGSRVDVLFKLEYIPNDELGFVDEPKLRWVETIKYRDDDSVWTFSSDMFHHNQYSLTFLPWRFRYIEAYHFSKAINKKSFNSMTRLYDRNMLPVTPDMLPAASTIDRKVEVVKEYLFNNGGILEVMVTDLPQVRISETPTHKERLVHFDLGLGEQSLVKFSQGVVLTKENKASVFITTSDDIQIARGEINSEPPEYVSRPRELKHRA